MSREMKFLWAILAIVGLCALVACDQFGDVDPIETACELCAVLDESGICQMTQAEQQALAGCTEAQDVAVKHDGSLVCVSREP